MLMLGPATSWQPGGQGLLLVLRLVTNLPSLSQPEVPKQYTYTATAIAAMACPDAGPSTLACAGLTRFICANCSATRRLSSRGLFQPAKFDGSRVCAKNLMGLVFEHLHLIM